MKKTILYLVISLFSLSLFAQSVEREAGSLLDLKYPQMPFNNAKTFSVQIEAPVLLIAHVDQILKELPDESKKDVLALKELKRYGRYPNVVSQYLAAYGLDYEYSDGEISILFEIEQAKLGGYIAKEKVEECGTKEEPKQCTTYYYDVTFKAPAKLTVKNEKGVVMYSEALFDPEKDPKAQFGNNSWGTFDSKEALIEAYNTNKKTFEQAVALSSIWQALIKSASILESKSFYAEQLKDVTIASAKKKFDYSDLDEARSTSFQGFAAINGKLPSEEAKSKLMEAIAAWEKALEEYEPEAKKVRINDKVASALYCNIGIAYMELNELEKASEYAQKADEIGKYKANTNALQKDLEEYIPLYEESKGVDPTLIEERTLPKDLSVGKGEVDINLIMELVKPNL